MSRGKPIFFTSDWHIGHANVIKFSNRPFTDIDHMERVLANNYNATVPANGVCYFLGDIAMCEPARLTAVISALHGTKVAIVGNHDRGSTALYQAGFDVVLHGATIYVGKHRVTMSHCPLLGVPREDMSEYPEKGPNWHGEYKNQKFSCRDEGQYHLSGHIHSPNGGKSVRELGRQYDVGVDANNYRPVSISAIESWVARTERQNKEVV